MAGRRLLQSAFHAALPLAAPGEVSRFLTGASLVVGCGLACAVELSKSSSSCRGWARDPLPQQSIVALSALINEAVDIPGMNEDEEMEIIQSAVERIVTEMENFMPQSYWDRIMRADKTVPDAQRELMQSRLIQHFQQSLHLPYLTESDQRLIVHATVAIVSDAMGDSKLDDILAQDATSVSLAAIFVREAMGIDNVDALRREVSEIIDLPVPLPEPVVKWVIGKGVSALVGILNEAVDVSLAECFGKSASRQVTSTADFQEVLRVNVVALLHRSMTVFLLPAFVEEFFISKVVETYFKFCVTTSRIDTAVAMLLKAK
ncbi:hypothetical protein H310_12841 [Aphanomyces invadans]|uniref:Uncharacterized protein n=1 Tax=Aphanomyces invadans TaxID=157072 RepID=A0A024THE5_9STRA|nr:hypothetical protein H310_12841 [Aphanomyces invadans]ETV93006.1 hypothetical protein H310_12841 [Aphanomyces invadans]|eukprot:XP_008878271.1 hypothetical protein H310_12841 [Aphanomyces invadans]